MIRALVESVTGETYGNTSRHVLDRGMKHSAATPTSRHVGLPAGTAITWDGSAFAAPLTPRSAVRLPRAGSTTCTTMPSHS